MCRLYILKIFICWLTFAFTHGIVQNKLVWFDLCVCMLSYVVNEKSWACVLRLEFKCRSCQRSKYGCKVMTIWSHGALCLAIILGMCSTAWASKNSLPNAGCVGCAVYQSACKSTYQFAYKSSTQCPHSGCIEFCVCERVVGEFPVLFSCLHFGELSCQPCQF